MEGSSGIYQIRNLVTDKVYVGSAVHFGRRWSLHKRRLRQQTHHSAKLQNAWNKYGEAHFEFTVLEVVADKGRLLEREQHWLDATNAPTDGMNMSPAAGSLLGAKFSDESRRRMSEAHRGVKKSPEHVENVRKALTGRTMTLEQREKMRVAKMGRKFGKRSPDVGAKISAANKGRKFTDEHRAKLSVAAQARVARLKQQAST